jgi:hypothetical protein
MYLRCSNYDGNNEAGWDFLNLEWISDDERFLIGFEGDEAFWIHVERNIEKCVHDSFNKEVLEYMYQRIGKILGKTQ